MSTNNSNSTDNNKDYDNDDNDRNWSDDCLEDEIFNQLMVSDDRYRNQAIKKFRYFRLKSPSVFFDIDVEDFNNDDLIICNLETCIKDCKTKEEKYDRLNGIITKVIFLIFKNTAEPHILSNTNEDKVMLKKSINEIQSLVFNKWKLIGINPMVSESNGLRELVGYTPPLSLLSSETSSSCNVDSQYSSNNYNPSTGNFQPYLTEELENIIKALKIDSVNNKILNSDRNNILEAVIDCLFHHHYNDMNIEDLKTFFFEINEKLCEKPLNKKEIESLWSQSTKLVKCGVDEKNLAKNNESSKSKGEDSQTHKESKNKKEYTVFKYTLDNKIHESVIIAGKPFYITFDKEKLELVEKIEQETRVLKPPHLEEYPSKPYTFENKEEIEKFVKMIKENGVSRDLLFRKIKEFVAKFIIHKPHVLDYISSLILFSYFQDKFPTVPYTMFVSDGGSGKSTIGNVFEDLGYRCVNMTDPTTANIFRIFGTIEAGQCTLVLDESEKIDGDKDMMSILKNGYEYGKRVQRVNPLGKQEHFHAFGLKILSAERSPNPSNAKGVIDRIFIFSNYKGKPELDIKEIRKPKTIDQKRIFEEIDFLRKSLFIYRIVHFNDEMADIETGLEGRDKELCKPLLQLFYNTKAQQRIEKIFEILLDEKNDRKANSLERDVLEVLIALFENYPHGIIPFNDIWCHLVDNTNGTINEFKQHEMETEIHGTIYKTTLARMLRDKFGAKDPRTRSSNIRALEFDIEKIKNHLDNYRKETPTKISCYRKVSDSSDSNDSNRKDRFKYFFSFEHSLEINPVEIDKNIPGGNLLEKEIFQYSNNETNSTELYNAVTTVTTITDLKDSSSNNDVYVKSSAPSMDGQDTGIPESDSISNNASILSSNDGLKTIGKNYDSDLTSDNNGLNPKIGKKGSLYYCKEHPKFKNIHLAEVENHLLHSKEHSQENSDIPSYYNRDMEIQSRKDSTYAN